MSLLERMGSVRPRVRRLIPAPIRRRFSLKVGILVGVVMLVVTASAAVIYVGADAAVQENTEDRLEGTSTMQGATLSEWNGRMNDQARSLATSRQLRRQPGQAISYLNLQHDRLPDYVVDLHLVETDTSNVVASTSRATIGTNFADQGVPWAEGGVEASTGDPARTAPYYDDVAETDAVAYVIQVEGDPSRALVLVVDLEERSRTLAQPPGNGHTTVVDSQGTVVFSHDVETVGQQNMPGQGVDSPAVEAGLDGESGYTEVEVNGTTIAMGYAPVPGTDWVAMIHVPASEAGAVSGLFLWSIGGMLLASFLALGLVAVVIGRGTAQDITGLAEAARRLEDGDLETSIESDRADELGDLYRSFDAMRRSLTDRIAEAEQARRAAETARQESEALNRHLESKAAAYSEVMRRVADGDLTGRMDPESRNEAMEEIAVEFNEMIDRLEVVTHEGKTFAEDVAASSEEVTASTEEVEGSARQVADSVQEISDGAERQNEQLQRVSEEINSLSTTIEQIAASADQVAKVAEQTAETGDEGREAAERAVEEMETVEREADRTVAAMEQLQEQMAAIEEVTEFISDVAEQTNILALNASIEASRAGEAGKGFAVVADEVKALAEETRLATEDVESRLEDVREQTEVTAGEVRETSTVVGETVDIVAGAVDSLEEIAQYAEETNTGIQEISAATADQAASTNQVVGMIDEAASIAEQTAREASAVASATEEQTAALSEMTDNAGDLAGEADRLRRTLGRFETEPGAEEIPAVASEAPTGEDATAEEPGSDEQAPREQPVPDPAAVEEVLETLEGEDHEEQPDSENADEAND